MVHSGNFTKENAAEMGRKGGSAGPSHTKKAREIQARFVERFQKDADKLYEAWLDRAMGVAIVVEKTDADGNKIVERVYREKPDPRSIQDMHNRALGKPAQPIEFDTPLVVADLSAEAKKMLKELEDYENDKKPASKKKKAGVSKVAKVSLKGAKRSATRVDKSVTKAKK